jgi:hypothetical protein
MSPAGKVLAEEVVDGVVASSPTLAPDGRVYLFDHAGTLIAYDGGHGGLMDSSWPKFQGDLANSGVEHWHQLQALLHLSSIIRDNPSLFRFSIFYFRFYQSGLCVQFRV